GPEATPGSASATGPEATPGSASATGPEATPGSAAEAAAKAPPPNTNPNGRPSAARPRRTTRPTNAGSAPARAVPGNHAKAELWTTRAAVDGYRASRNRTRACPGPA